MTKHISHPARSKVLDAPLPFPLPRLAEALDEVRLSADRFCLLAGTEALQAHNRQAHANSVLETIMTAAKRDHTAMPAS